VAVYADGQPRRWLINLPSSASVRPTSTAGRAVRPQADRAEYHYRGKDKRILVRISGKVKPSQAKKFETAVAAL
jgi:hypothetical protein